MARADDLVQAAGHQDTVSGKTMAGVRRIFDKLSRLRG